MRLPRLPRRELGVGGGAGVVVVARTMMPSSFAAAAAAAAARSPPRRKWRRARYERTIRATSVAAPERVAVGRKRRASENDRASRATLRAARPRARAAMRASGHVAELRAELGDERRRRAVLRGRRGHRRRGGRGGNGRRAVRRRCCRAHEELLRARRVEELPAQAAVVLDLGVLSPDALGVGTPIVPQVDELGIDVLRAGRSSESGSAELHAHVEAEVLHALRPRAADVDRASRVRGGRGRRQRASALRRVERRGGRRGGQSSVFARHVHQRNPHITCKLRLA